MILYIHAHRGKWAFNSLNLFHPSPDPPLVTMSLLSIVESVPYNSYLLKFFNSNLIQSLNYFK